MLFSTKYATTPKQMVSLMIGSITSNQKKNNKKKQQKKNYDLAGLHDVLI